MYIHKQHRVTSHPREVSPWIPCILLFLLCESCWLVFLAPTDVTRYQCYALTFWLGSHATTLLPNAQCSFLPVTVLQPPLHMLPLEYPPLTLLLFSLPLLVPLPYYTLAFALLISFALFLIFYLLTRSGPRASAQIFVLYMVIGACFTAQVRFDVVPAGLTLFCVAGAERKYWKTAYVALALGVLLKLYPIVLLPSLFITEQQALGCIHVPFKLTSFREAPRCVWYALREVANWRWKHALLFFGLLLGGTGIFALFNFQGAVLSPISYFLQRPIQIESVDSTVLWMAKQMGAPYRVMFTYGSLNVISPLSGAVSCMGTGLFLAGYLFVHWLQWHKQMNLAQTMIALVLLLVTTGKVFSPQYLIWLIPLLAYADVGSLLWRYAWGAVSLLTTFIYVFFYSHLPDPHTAPYITQSLTGFYETICIRNVGFVFITLAYLFNWFKVRQHPPFPQLPTDKGKQIDDVYALATGYIQRVDVVLAEDEPARSVGAR